MWHTQTSFSPLPARTSSTVNRSTFLPLWKVILYGLVYSSTKTNQKKIYFTTNTFDPWHLRMQFYSVGATVSEIKTAKMCETDLIKIFIKLTKIFVLLCLQSFDLF